MERVKYLLLSNFDSQVNAGKVINVVKKLFLLVSVLISSSLLLGFDSFCSIDKELNKDTAKKLKEVRNQTHSICLNCSGDSCTLKSWPTEKSNDAEICKLLFCTPSRVSRVFKLPEGAENGKSLISFDYFIFNSLTQQVHQVSSVGAGSFPLLRDSERGLRVDSASM